MEAALRARLIAFPPGGPLRSPPASSRLRPRRRDRHVLGHPQTRSFGELLIDVEEDPAIRAVLIGMLMEG